MYGQFIRDMTEGTDKEKSRLWWREYDLQIPSEALICSAQEQSIKTNYGKYHINKSVGSPSCIMCGETGETISHIVSECSKPRGSTKEGMTMWLEWFIRNCVRNSILKSLKNSIYTFLKLFVKMLTIN